MSREKNGPPDDDDLALWCDYVRGLTDDELTARLDALRRSSPEADRIARLFALVAEVGRADATAPVPEPARRLARALGSLREREAPWRSWRRRAFDLVFDSALAPATAGVRDLAPTRPSERVYEAEDLVVEVRHEAGDADGDVVVGQVVRLRPPARPASDLPILVVVGEQVVARTRSGRFGEFYCEHLPAEPMRLCVLVDDESVLDLPVGPAAGAGE